MSKKIFVIAGEQSGDLHGEQLLKALYKIQPDLIIIGIGGPKMRTQGMQCLIPMEQFQVMGFIDVIRHLPKLWRLFKTVQTQILQEQPDIVVTIDYPGFNLRLARSLRKKGFTGKLCHYICPSVWAWGKSRIQLMANHFDLLLSILPFEKRYFQNTKLPVVYVGHPLVAQLSNKTHVPSANLVAIFPGSRASEIKRNLPLFLQTVHTLQKTHPQLKFAISIANQHVAPLIQQQLDSSNSQHIQLITDSATLMCSAYMALAKSGTVTLELALLGIPTVVAYKISKIDHFLARFIFRIRLPFYCIVNIIAQKQLFPEFIGSRLSAQDLSHTLSEWIDKPDTYQAITKLCLEVKHILGTNNASEQAAHALLNQ